MSKGLGSILVLSSGCISVGQMNQNEVGTNSRRVTVNSIDDVPREAGVTFSVEVTDDSITPESSARIRSTMTNEGNEGVHVQLPFYKGASSWTGEAGVLLYSLEAPDSPSVDYTPACFDGDGQTRDDVAWSSEGTPRYRLAAGDSHSNELILVDDPTVEGCFPSGTYRFESEHEVRDVQFMWGFSLNIAEFEG